MLISIKEKQLETVNTAFLIYLLFCCPNFSSLHFSKPKPHA